MNILTSLLKRRDVVEVVEDKRMAKTDFIKAAFGAIERTYGFLGDTYKLSEFLNRFKGHIFDCVSLTAESLASKSWNFHDGTGKIIKYEKLERTLSQPTLKMDWHDLAYATTASLELTGNSYWYPDLFFDKIYFIPSDRIQFKKDRNGYVIGYEIRIRDKAKTFMLEDIIHFKYPDPRNPESYGWGPVQAIEDSWDKYEDVSTYEKSILDNMGIISILLRGGDTTEQLEKMVKLWQEQCSGKRKAGMIAGVNKDWEVLDGVGFSPEQMDFTRIKKSVVDEIYQGMRVPQLLVGITEKVNRSNMYEAKLAFQEFKINPIAMRFQRYINRYLIAEKDIIFKFNYQLPKDPVLEIKRQGMHIDKGVRSRNEVRTQDEGLLPYKGGDVIYVDMNKVPAYDASLLQEVSRAYKPEVEQKDFPNIITYNAVTHGERIWKVFDKWQGNLEGRMITSLDSYWRWLGRKVAKNLSDMQIGKGVKQQDVDILAQMVILNIDDIADELQGKSAAHIEEAIRRAAIMKGTELGIEISDNLIDHYLRAHFADLEKIWKGIAGTDIDQLKKIISEGLDEGLNLGGIARNISRKYNPTSADYMNVKRGIAIARTETSRAANRTSHEVLIVGGTGRTVWICALDGRERATHQAAHGQEVDINEPYIVGGEPLQYPGDLNGSAENVIKCRCIEADAKIYYH